MSTQATNHTPGPWRKHTTIGKTYANVRGIDGRCVADCGSRCDPTAQANATLIALAPEMLEMLKQAHTFIGEACIDGELENCNILAEMFALINRAEGRS